MKRFSVHGRDVEGGAWQDVVHIDGAWGDWSLRKYAEGDPFTQIGSDIAFTKWGAKRLARKMLRRRRCFS